MFGYGELGDKETFTSQLRSSILQHKTINCKNYINIYRCTNTSNFCLRFLFWKIKGRLMRSSYCLSLYPSFSVCACLWIRLCLSICLCIPF
jgi:hypothetical protein